MKKRIIVSVISDLVTDQRVQKECNTFHKMGYEVLLIGRKSERRFSLDELSYKSVRFSNPFRRGPLMYVVFNLRLFAYLLFKRSDVFWANDLDTLLPNFIIARLRNKKLVYDSHEYFTESVYKKSSKKIWKILEKALFPRLKNVITVNHSIKSVYENKYHVPVTVVRNVPYKFEKGKVMHRPVLPVNRKVLVMQGMGLNEHRGAEEAVLMMQFLPGDFLLYFIGAGTILNKLQQMVKDLRLESKIIFIGILPYQQMMEYTRQSFLGLVFEKIDYSDEHRFALPNRFFDYIHAGIPVLSSKATEIKLIIEKYQVGDFIDNFEPERMAAKIIDIARNSEVYDFWKQNTGIASDELKWENEEKVLIQFMDHLC